MKKAVIILLTVIVAQMSACIKDDPNPTVSDADTKVYSIKKYKDNVLISQFGYTQKKLTQLETFNTDGSINSSSKFHYLNSRLDYIVTTYSAGGFVGKTQFSYDSENKIVKISKQVSTLTSKIFNIQYDNFDKVLKIDWELENSPLNGELNFDDFGNVTKFVNNYIESSKNTRNKDVDLISYNQFMNPVQRFWVVDPIMFSPSNNNRVELIRNRALNLDWNSGSGGTWSYENYLFKYKNKYNGNNYLIEYSKSDTSNTIFEHVEFEYKGF